jgi:serine/threonine protein kinase
MMGRVIGHYRITEKLNEGGMGIVYLARDEHLPREVAIKVIASAKVADEEARLRFRNEAFSLARLNHPNIGTIYDYISQDGQEFIVMEYVPGMTLDAQLSGFQDYRIGCTGAGCPLWWHPSIYGARAGLRRKGG